MMTLLAFGALALGAGCHSDRNDDDGPMENAGEKLDQAGRDTRDAAKEVGDDVEDAVDNDDDDGPDHDD
jgi:hypothetical protein